MKKILFVYVLAFVMGLMYDYKNLVPRVYHGYCLEAYMYKEKREVIDQGNVLAYKKIVASMKDSAWISPEASFYYSLFMATKFNYAPAYYDVYHTLMTVMDGKGTLSEDTKQLAMAFLRRGAALNDERCIRTLATIH